MRRRCYIEPGVVASVTDLPAELVTRVLDEEPQHATILTPHVSGYCFQHDSWIDALTGTCPPAQLRELHARCLALMRADPAADPRRLADHAIGAGAGLVGGRELAALARQAADLAFADYAFGRAAELYEVAARYTAGADRVVASTGTFAGLPSGPSRIAILATAAMLLGHPLLSGALPTDEATSWGEAIAGLLARHPDKFVVAGWPAVILGSKHRYIGLAHLAAGQPAEAAGHLTLAADQNSHFGSPARQDTVRSRPFPPQTAGQPLSRVRGDWSCRAAGNRAWHAGLAAQAVAESVR